MQPQCRFQAASSSRGGSGSASDGHPRPRSMATPSDLVGRPLYYVTADITACYDSISHDVLMRIVHESLSSSRYAIHPYVVAAPARAADGSASLRCTAMRLVASTEAFLSLRDISERVTAETANIRSNTPKSSANTSQTPAPNTANRRVVFVHAMRPCTVRTRDALVATIKQHVYANSVVFAAPLVQHRGSRAFRQVRGISQGSVLSPMLCSLYYARMDTTHLRELVSESDWSGLGKCIGKANGRGIVEDNGPLMGHSRQRTMSDCLSLMIRSVGWMIGLLVGWLTDGFYGESSSNIHWSITNTSRFIDDFLYITTDMTKAQRFLALVHKGVPEYQAVFNPSKIYNQPAPQRPSRPLVRRSGSQFQDRVVRAGNKPFASLCLAIAA